MPIRTFVSSAGVPWRVWSVIPGARLDEERRAGYDRRSPDPVLRYTGPERRASADRRRSGELFAAEFRLGWLAFESPTERRRLAPIPPAWDRLSDAEMERMCQRARPVPGAPPAPPG